MATGLWLKHVTEIWGGTGPTGRFAEVTHGEIRDAGGNVLYRGTADDCTAERPSWRVPTKLVPTRWRAVVGDVAGADHVWELVIE